MFRKLIKEQLLLEADEVRFMFKMDIPEDIRKIQKVFKSKGKDLYLVGGSVRDALLSKAPKDWDLATDATPDEVIQMLKVESFITNVIETGKSFGVINALTDNDEYEIATFRSESGYEDSRRPSNVEFSDIATDVMRRDLTINALFYDLDTNEVVDLVGGVEDIKNGVVRTVGDAGERFEEDKLRVLRAIRFAGRFGSNVDADIDKVLSKGIDMSEISGERIRDEFIKGISKARSTVQFLGLLDKYKLFDAIFPNMSINKNFIESNDPELVIASLLLQYVNKDIGQVEKMLNSLKYSTQEIKAITTLMLLTQFEPEDVLPMKKRLKLSTLSNEQIKNFSTLMGLDANLINKLLEFQLSVNGQEVMKQFNVKGEDVGKMINKLEVEKFITTIM
jgi:tRNA nucleotidyltransferase/poly(A) polymerase